MAGESPRGAKKLQIDVQGAASIDELGELEELETLTLRGYTMDLAPLATLSRLRSLSPDISRDVKGLEHPCRPDRPSNAMDPLEATGAPGSQDGRS